MRDRETYHIAGNSPEKHFPTVARQATHETFTSVFLARREQHFLFHGRPDSQMHTSLRCVLVSKTDGRMLCMKILPTSAHKIVLLLSELRCLHVQSATET